MSGERRRGLAEPAHLRGPDRVLHRRRPFTHAPLLEWSQCGRRPSCDGVADRFRAIVPGGLDAVADGALLHELVIPAIRDGGQIAVLRLWEGEAERRIKVHPFSVRSYASNTAAIDSVREHIDTGALSIRVGAVLPYAEAVEAHRRLERGGLRGRIILEF